MRNHRGCCATSPVGLTITAFEAAKKSSHTRSKITSHATPTPSGIRLKNPFGLDRLSLSNWLWRDARWLFGWSRRSKRTQKSGFERFDALESFLGVELRGFSYYTRNARVGHGSFLITARSRAKRQHFAERVGHRYAHRSGRSRTARVAHRRAYRNRSCPS